MKVCLTAKTLYYPQGGGHLWVYLNWALGLRASGVDVVWMEGANPDLPAEQQQTFVRALKSRLAEYGLADAVALLPWYGGGFPNGGVDGCLDLSAAAEADLLLDLIYLVDPAQVTRFKRSALLDIDPGLTQMWMHRGTLSVAPHDAYFTIGETVGRPGSKVPDVGLPWLYTPPCVALDWWPVRGAPEGAPFSTITHWNMREWEVDEQGVYSNDKRTGFEPFLELPRHTRQPLELAVCLGEHDQSERERLTELGWRVRDSHAVSSTPQDYQRYIQGSRGEFSCVKPSCIRMQNAWISDRTLCFLASGKPAIVEHTGPSRFLPDAAGLLRFRTPQEAAERLELAANDYDHQCRLARSLAEEFFDAKKVTAKVLERAM
jgi:hypothetical protein